MKKQHTAPCRECPFRRTAPPGWLGGYTAAEFRLLAEHETRMPCHQRMKGTAVTYANPGTTVPQCAGRAIYWANQYKTVRTKGVLLELPRDTVTVFEWPHEFVAHHKRVSP